MELGQDWIKYRDFMNPKRRLKTPKFSNQTLFVSDNAKTVRVVSDSDNLNSSSGQLLSDAMMQTEPRHSPLVVEAERLDAALAQAAQADAYALEQVSMLRDKVKPTFGSFSQWEEPFLVEAMHSWWGRLLPSSFGVYLSLSDNPNQSILLLFKKGRLDSFGEPDLSSLSEERRRSADEIVKYLREKFSLPVQGLRIKSQDWEAVTEDAHPWKKISQLIRSDSASLVPFRVLTAALIGTKGILGY